MYALRAVAVSFSAFVLAYAFVLACVRCAWPVLRRRLAAMRSGFLANTLFACQIAPFVVGFGVVAVLILPSFVRFEPHASDEAISAMPVALAVIGLGIVIAGVARAVASLRVTRAVAKSWAHEPCRFDGGAVRAYHAPTHGVLAVAGVADPKLFVSSDIRTTLTPAELERAVAHEMVHMRRRDNLAKLALVLCRAPGMAVIERAWAEAVEMTADERAVNTQAEALELASALIKVSRLRMARLPELATGFAARTASPLAARVERLLAWEPRRNDHRPWFAYALLGVSAATVIATALSYHPLLQEAHALTEWLVR